MCTRVCVGDENWGGRRYRGCWRLRVFESDLWPEKNREGTGKKEYYGREDCNLLRIRNELISPTISGRRIAESGANALLEDVGHKKRRAPSSRVLRRQEHRTKSGINNELWAAERRTFSPVS